MLSALKKTHAHKHTHIPVYMGIHQVAALWLFDWESIFLLRMTRTKEIRDPRKYSGLVIWAFSAQLKLSCWMRKLIKGKFHLVFEQLAIVIVNKRLPEMLYFLFRYWKVVNSESNRLYLWLHNRRLDDHVVYRIHGS